MSTVVTLCEHGRMVKLRVRFLAFKYYGSNFNINETVSKFLLSSKDGNQNLRHQIMFLKTLGPQPSWKSAWELLGQSQFWLCPNVFLLYENTCAASETANYGNDFEMVTVLTLLLSSGQKWPKTVLNSREGACTLNDLTTCATIIFDLEVKIIVT